MRDIIAGVLLIGSTLGMAGPAAAQYYPQQQRGYGYDYRNSPSSADRWIEQVRQIHDEIRQLSYSGHLNGREARRLEYDARVVINAAEQYSYNGMNRWRAQDLDRRVWNLRQAVGRAASNGQYRRTNREYYQDRHRSGFDY
jgi:hypothetical protein